MKYITESEVRAKLTVPQCIEVLRNAFSHDFINIPRYRLKSQNSLLHVMSASIPDLGMMGLKAYSTTREGNSFCVLLFDEQRGDLLAVVEADAMGQIRTGAASGLATDLLANSDARIGAVIGTGFQAETQLLAIDSVRTFDEIRIFSRTPQKRAEFIERMKPKIKARLVESTSNEECVRGADVICAITSSKEPVVAGEWLKAGCHINAAGTNWANKRELDEQVIKRTGLICVDHLEQSKIESGDLIAVFHNPEDWNKVSELSGVVRGSVRRTSSDQITLFKSNGIAAEDVAAAHYIYNLG